MKIAFICEYYHPHVGGVEVVFEQLATRMVKMGHECHVVTCQLKNTIGHEEKDGVIIHRVIVPRKGDRYWFSLAAIPKVMSVVKDCDIVHTTTFNAALPAWLAARFTDKKCVITVHEVWGNQWDNLSNNRFSATMHKWAENIILKLPFDAYCCVSDATNEALRRHFGQKNRDITTIYNGIDYELFNPDKVDGDIVRKKLNLNDEFIYLYYGRPGVSKGLEYLIKAVPRVSHRIKKSKLLLILAHSPHQRYNAILKLIKKLQIVNNIILINPVEKNELPLYIQAADCVVVPSLTEGFGFAAAEACAMGKPLVASKVGSLMEVVSGKHIFVEPKNPNAIAKALFKISKGEINIVPEKSFSWDSCANKYISTYYEAINNHLGDKC